VSLIRVGVRANDYAEAIAAAGDLLVSAGHVSPEYVPAMTRVVDELGPYMVLVEGFALAHAEPGELVYKNSISLAVLRESVDFGSGKMVKAVFAMAAKDHESHIEALGELATLLSDETLRNDVLNATEIDAIGSRLSSVLGE
jgi:PTS system ascorbate-specific IIA component